MRSFSKLRISRNTAVWFSGLAAVGLTAARPVQAQTVEVTASGILDQVTSPSAFDSSVMVGTAFHINFFYALGTPGSVTGDPAIGYYYFPGSAYGMEGTFGDYTISRSASGSVVSVFNHPSGTTEYQIQLNSYGSALTSTNPAAQSLPGQTQFSLAFTDYTGTVANSTALPAASIYTLSNFSPSYLNPVFFITYFPGPDQLGEIDGTITSLSAQTIPAAVPEASTTVSFGLLLALGMGGLVIAAKRKKAAVA